MKKKVKSGDSDYVEKDEVLDKKRKKKEAKSMKTAGIAKELANSEKQMGYGKLIKVKPMKK